MSNLESKQIMAKNIQYYMNKYEKSRQDMCEALGVKYTTFTDWVKGNAYPRIDKIELIANYFGISKADLVEEHHLLSQKKKGVVIPVLDRVTADISFEAIEDHIIDMEEITEEMAATGTHFGLKIQGDSMEPRICKKDVVIVRQQDDAESGDLVIATINGAEATCKRLRKYRDGIELISNNPAYKPMFYSNEEIQQKSIHILGKVVELRGKF